MKDDLNITDNYKIYKVLTHSAPRGEECSLAGSTIFFGFLVIDCILGF